VLAPDVARRVALDSADDGARLTRDLVYSAFELDNLAGQADRDPTALSMSGLGGCTRAAAYSIGRIPPSDVAGPEDARQAVLGTWIHLHLLPLMAELLGDGAVYEEAVQLRAGGLVIPGTLDLALPEVVWDLKSVKEWRLHGVRRRGTYSEHRTQVLAYATARWQAGHPVKWVCWLYLHRDTGDIHVEVERFTNAAALAVIERIEDIRYHSEEPDKAPREGHGPGLALACDRCPWLRRCWGPTAVPGQKGAQQSMAVTIEGVAEALAIYARGAELTGPAEKDKEFAKLVLAAVPDGTYGPWILKRGKPGERPDQAAMIETLTRMGMPIPMKRSAGAISVRPAPQEV
jgi:hypothetical protein